MEARATATERRIVPSVVAAGSRFGRYEPEEERHVKSADIKEDEVLRQLRAAWAKCSPRLYNADHYSYEDTFVKLSHISCSAADVERFSLVLAEFQDEKWFSYKAGIFLSAIVNNGRDSDYVVRTGHLKSPPDSLGCKNRKNLTIIGDVGDWLGSYMAGGRITLKGNAGIQVGYGMEGGEIFIHGIAVSITPNAYDYVFYVREK